MNTVDSRVKNKPILNPKQKRWDTRLPKEQLYEKVLSVRECQCQCIVSESAWLS